MIATETLDASSPGRMTVSVKPQCLHLAQCRTMASGPWQKEAETAFQPTYECEVSKQVSHRASPWARPNLGWQRFSCLERGEPY